METDAEQIYTGFCDEMNVCSLLDSHLMLTDVCVCMSWRNLCDEDFEEQFVNSYLDVLEMKLMSE